jgi:hypothetical protein
MLQTLRTKRILNGIVLISLFGWAIFSNVAFATYSVGVKNGDWIRYDISISSAGQTATGSIKIIIQQVQGVQITGTYEVTVQGYSVMQPTQFSLDISIGSGSYATGFIIPANLTAGQLIPGETAYVQSIVDWNGRRAILTNATSPFGGFNGQIYWDQQTGVLLEAKGSAVGATYGLTAAETSLWSGGLLGAGALTWIIVIIVVVVAIAVAALVLRRRRTLPATPSPPQMAQSPPPPPPP